MPNKRSAIFPAEISCLGEVIRFVDGWSEEIRLANRRCYSLRLIVDELVSNICRHGSVPEGATVTLTLFQTDETIVLEIRDSGVPFNPLEHTEPDISSPLEERSIGGLGLLLVRRLSQKMFYRREDNQNVQTIVLDNRDDP